jgi:putative protease
VPLHLLARDPKLCRELSRRVEVAAVLPRICHDSELDQLRIQMRAIREQGIKAVLVGNLGLLLPAREAGMRIHGDFGLNIYNSGAVNAARDLELASAMLSFEMTLPQIRDVSKAVPCEIFAYGRLPLMVTENCLIRGLSGDCTCHLGATRLMDKTGADFPVIKDGNSCRSVLLNGKKLYWLDRQDDFAKLGLWATRLYFTTENAKEVDQVLNNYLNFAPFAPGNCTRGLYLRGLD